MSRPLAEVVPVYSGPNIDTYDVTVAGLTVANAHLATLADDIAAHLNHHHAAAVAPLQARLAMAREALVFVREQVLALANRDAGKAEAELPPAHRLALEWAELGRAVHKRACDAMAAIDADPPGRWRTEEEYQQLAAVVDDLRQETASVHKERNTAALNLLRDALAKHVAMFGEFTDDRTVNRVIAVLQGRDEPGPVKATLPFVAETARLNAIHRGGYTGDDPEEP